MSAGAKKEMMALELDSIIYGTEGCDRRAAAPQLHRASRTETSADLGQGPVKINANKATRLASLRNLIFIANKTEIRVPFIGTNLEQIVFSAPNHSALSIMTSQHAMPPIFTGTLNSRTQYEKQTRMVIHFPLPIAEEPFLHLSTKSHFSRVVA